MLRAPLTGRKPSALASSKIDKLSILGIRSFDNQRSETIQFHTPLTLIVGLNGSGKTTIIECLKYMTTGEMPVGSRTGGAFIHDPKLCGEREVHAQVKLSFVNTAGNKMVASRSMLLTVKKNTRTFKALESNLVKYRDGERSSASSRQAEISDLVPRHLGVSKAILEYVIFCHQDDSLWPMSEPAELKKRFDRIFEALKYTKAIDNLKAIKKNYGVELGKLRIHEVNAKQTKDRGEQAQKRTEELLDQIEKLKEKKNKLADQIKEAQNHYDETWNQLNRLSGIVGQLNGKRIEQKSVKEAVERLHRNIKQYKETDEELKAMLDQHKERMALLRTSATTERQRYNDITEQLKNAKVTLGQKERVLGALEAGQVNHDRQLAARESLIKHTARHHNVRGFDVDINSDKVAQFMLRMNKMTSEQRDLAEQNRIQSRQEVQQAQATLNKADQEKSTLTMQKDTARANITSNESKIGSQQSALNRIDVDEGGKAVLQATMTEVQKRLAAAKADFEQANWSRTVQTAEADVRKLDDDKEQLDAELVEGTKRAGDTAQLDFVRKEFKDRQRSAETMNATHDKSFKDLIKTDWQPQTLERDYQRIVDSCTAQLTEVERQRDGASRECEQVAFKLKTCQADLKNKLDAMRAAEQKIRHAIDDKPSEYMARLDELEKERDILQGDLASCTKLEEYWKSCVTSLEKHNCCRLCTRAFDSPKASSDFLGHLQNLLSKFDRETLKQEVEDQEAEYATIKDAQQSYDLWSRLEQTEVPAIQTEEGRLGAQHTRMVLELERHDQEVSIKAEKKRDISAIAKAVQQVVKYHTEIDSLERQIGELSVKHESIGESRGLDLVQDDLKMINERSRTAKAALLKLTNERDRARSAIASMELELRDVQSSLNTAVYQLKERDALSGDIAERKKVITSLREDTRKMDSRLQELALERNRAQAKYDDISRQVEDKERQLQEGVSNLNSSLHKLELANQTIKEYIDRRGAQQLADAKVQMQTINAEIIKLDKTSNEIAKEINYISDELRNVDETKRTIADNQDFRQSQRALEGIQREINELESHNAEADKQHYDRLAAKWQNERNRLTAEQSVIIGEMKSKDSQLEGLLADYDTSYKDAAFQYKEAHIKVETTKAAIEDIGRYASALDQAIMKFHTLKMEEINRIVDELWRRTYQGTDVDSILIRSDNENLKGNKTYNYRVCMVKQETEMDMRGRCSAGQKVLASIIIRLALAECFGVNCGLIALDEPTTNLDQANIRALAESLSEIIRARRQQSNFQLIVITHDEEFLRHMHCSDFADYYYRISRNDKQKSVIEIQNIAEVM